MLLFHLKTLLRYLFVRLLSRIVETRGELRIIDLKTEMVKKRLSFEGMMQRAGKKSKIVYTSESTFAISIDHQIQLYTAGV